MLCFYSGTIQSLSRVIAYYDVETRGPSVHLSLHALIFMMYLIKLISMHVCLFGNTSTNAWILLSDERTARDINISA